MKGRHRRFPGVEVGGVADAQTPKSHSGNGHNKTSGPKPIQRIGRGGTGLSYYRARYYDFLNQTIPRVGLGGRMRNGFWARGGRGPRPGITQRTPPDMAHCLSAYLTSAVSAKGHADPETWCVSRYLHPWF
jgi:hypothetical protein